MSTKDSPTRTDIHGFAMFSVHPKEVDRPESFKHAFEPQVLLHGYVHTQNVGDILGRAKTQTLKDGSQPLPGDFVSLRKVFEQVVKNPVCI